MIRIEHLNKTYVSRQGETHIALTDINLTIEDGSRYRRGFGQYVIMELCA